MSLTRFGQSVLDSPCIGSGAVCRAAYVIDRCGLTGGNFTNERVHIGTRVAGSASANIGRYDLAVLDDHRRLDITVAARTRRDECAIAVRCGGCLGSSEVTVGGQGEGVLGRKVAHPVHGYYDRGAEADQAVCDAPPFAFAPFGVGLNCTSRCGARTAAYIPFGHRIDILI